MKWIPQESQLREDNKLHKVTVLKNGNSYTLSWNGRTKVFRGNKESFIKFIKRLKVKDTDSSPKSARKKTYSQIADELDNQTSISVYVWGYMLNRFPSNHYEG